MRRLTANVFQRALTHRGVDAGIARLPGDSAVGSVSGKASSGAALPVPAGSGRQQGPCQGTLAGARLPVFHAGVMTAPRHGQGQAPRYRHLTTAASASTPAPFSTCDLCDANTERLAAGTLAVLPPIFQAYGKRNTFSGKAYTLQVFEDNTLVRSTLEAPGHGQVLVIDGAGSTRRALLGGNLAMLAAKNGWAGVVVFGAIRDVAEIDACETGVRALAPNPHRSEKNGAGKRNVPIRIGHVPVEPGDWVYADRDGVLVSQDPLM